jgi:hypothetical protein
VMKANKENCFAIQLQTPKHILCSRYEHDRTIAVDNRATINQYRIRIDEPSESQRRRGEEMKASSVPQGTILSGAA